MGNTGQATLLCSRVAVLSITSLSLGLSKLTVAMALPNTSCAQLMVLGGVVVIWWVSSLRSRLSRGRSISRCGPSVTGWLYSYSVRWVIEKRVKDQTARLARFLGVAGG